MSQFDYKPFYRRNLPHLQPLGATFFITFRLAGTLPRWLLQQWAQEKRQHEAIRARLTDEQERAQRKREWQRRWFRQFETVLDKAESGPMWLKDERAAAQVAESLRYRDGKVYRLDAYCIMPNHVHAVFAPYVTQTVSLRDDMQTNSLRYEEAQTNRLRDEETDDDRLRSSLARILHSLKGYTAFKVNRILERRGGFWEHESYDHHVRNEREWERIVAYVLNNPVKAGLAKDWQEWRWSYYRYAP